MRARNHNTTPHVGGVQVGVPNASKFCNTYTSLSDAMYRKRAPSFSRKVKFSGDFNASGEPFNIPKKGDAIPPKGKTGTKKLTPLPHSPVPPPFEPPFSAESDGDEGGSILPPVSDRRASFAGFSDTTKSSLWPPERRYSVAMPKEKKVELLSALREQSENAHRLSISSQGGMTKESLSLSLPRDRASLSTSVEGSYSHDSDEFVDNLTKQKMNMQLKSITDRMFEVLPMIRCACSPSLPPPPCATYCPPSTPLRIFSQGQCKLLYVIPFAGFRGI